MNQLSVQIENNQVHTKHLINKIEDKI